MVRLTWDELLLNRPPRGGGLLARIPPAAGIGLQASGRPAGACRAAAGGCHRGGLSHPPFLTPCEQ